MWFVVVVFMLLPSSLLAQEDMQSPSVRGQLAAMYNTVAGSYNFWLYAPREYVGEHQRIPVIIFLHGASLCGTNLQRVRRYGLLEAIEKVLPCLCHCSSESRWFVETFKDCQDS